VVQDPFGAAPALNDGPDSTPKPVRVLKPASVLVMTPAPALKKQPLAGLAEKRGAASIEALENSLNAIVKVDFVEEPLKDVIQRISDIVDVPIVLSLKKLEEASVSPDTPITKALKGITLRSVLRTILKDLELTYAIRDEMIHITTPEDAESQLISRIYHCRDLIDWAAGRGLLKDGAQPKQPDLTSLDDKRALVLMEFLTSTVKPDSWDDVGGPGAIYNFYGLFIVFQTAEVHEQIEDSLQMLRDAATVDQPRGRKTIQQRRIPGVPGNGAAGEAGAEGGRGGAGGGMGGMGGGMGGQF
jgi:hypothetical protein